MKLLKLNEKGVAHYLAAVLVVVVIGAIGTYVMTQSHAEAPPTVESSSNQTTSQSNLPQAHIDVNSGLSGLAKGKKHDTSTFCYNYGAYPPIQCYYWVGMEEDGTNFTSSGASVSLTQSGPSVSPKDWHSLSELYVGNDNAVEMGWEVSPLVFGDSLPHLFFDPWEGDYECVNSNQEACGFVQLSSKYVWGSTLQTGATGTFSVEYQNNDWVVSYDGVTLGYYPESVWTNVSQSFTTAISVEAYGEVDSSSPNTPESQMGNGKYGSNSRSAAISNLDYVNGANAAIVNYFAQGSTNYNYGGTSSTTCTTSCSMNFGGPGYPETPGPTLNINPITSSGDTASIYGSAVTYVPAQITSVTINWGDGTTTTLPGTGYIEGNGPFPFTFNSSHTYAKNGSYKITTTAVNTKGKTSSSQIISIS